MLAVVVPEGARAGYLVNLRPNLTRAKSWRHSLVAMLRVNDSIAWDIVSNGEQLSLYHPSTMLREALDDVAYESIELLVGEH